MITRIIIVMLSDIYNLQLTKFSFTEIPITILVLIRLVFQNYIY